MSRGPKNVTSTTNSAPPEYLAGPLKQAAGTIMSQYNNPALQNSIFGSLDQQFGRAADLTRGRLDSEFASAGRNLGASMPARSQELQTLASNIYDPANLYNYDPTNVMINRLSALIPGAGGTTTSTQPVIKTGIFG